MQNSTTRELLSVQELSGLQINKETTENSTFSHMAVSIIITTTMSQAPVSNISSRSSRMRNMEAYYHNIGHVR